MSCPCDLKVVEYLGYTLAGFATIIAAIVAKPYIKEEVGKIRAYCQKQHERLAQGLGIMPLPEELRAVIAPPSRELTSYSRYGASLSMF